MEVWQKVFDTSDFPPRWFCGVWTTGHGGLQIVSGLAIPCILAYFMWQRKDFPFRGTMLLFASFILIWGTTHLMEAIIIWRTAYRLAVVFKFLTAVVSCITSVSLIRIAPFALAMRSPDDLQREIDARAGAELAFQAANNKLEQRVKSRT